jgi:hypothetical protein
MPLPLRRLVARDLFKNHLTAFAVSNLRRIHNPRAILRAHHNSVQQNKHRQREVQIQQRLGR